MDNTQEKKILPQQMPKDSPEYILWHERTFKDGSVSSANAKKMGLMNKGKTRTDESKQKQADSTTGEKNHFFGRKHSEETKRRISESRKGKCTGEDNPKHNGIIVKKCKQCGIEIQWAPSHFKQENYGTFCSNDCKYKWMSLNITGSASPKWVGGSKGYCEKWTKEFRNRIRSYNAIYNNNQVTCEGCGSIQGYDLYHCHHVYYDKKACCSINVDGKYLSNLGISYQPQDFEIDGDPNKFAVLCKKCHAKTSSIKNRKLWARYYEHIINTKYQGRSYFTVEEWELLNPTNPQ